MSRDTLDSIGGFKSRDSLHSALGLSMQPEKHGTCVSAADKRTCNQHQLATNNVHLTTHTPRTVVQQAGVKPRLHVLNQVTLNRIRIRIRSGYTCSCEASL